MGEGGEILWCEGRVIGRLRHSIISRSANPGSTKIALRHSRPIDPMRDDSAWPIDSDKRFDPIDVLHYAIEELGHTQTELAELLGSRSRASEIFARRRALTVDMIHKLSEAWKIPADLLVRPYRVDSAA
jgi:hypothetical protein